MGAWRSKLSGVQRVGGAVGVVALGNLFSEGCCVGAPLLVPQVVAAGGVGIAVGAEKVPGGSVIQKMP